MDQTPQAPAPRTGKIRFDPRLYNASPADILDVLQTMVKPEPRSVMIVGHNPGLEELVNQLTGESPDLPTAALAEIHLPIDGWRDLHGSIRGVLANLWRPKELP